MVHGAELDEIAVHLMRDERLSGIFSIEVIPVQCTLFVKSKESNWLVSLHQDLSIPVAERIDSPGFQGWSEKEGELFVQPPVSVLSRMRVCESTPSVVGKV